MTQVARPRSPQSGDAAAPRRPRWAGPLVAGLAFGLAYGVTQRLVSLNVGELIRLADRHHIVEKGRVVWAGTSTELARDRDLQHRYLGV